MTGRAAAAGLAECAFPEEAERHECRQPIGHHGAPKFRLSFQFLAGCRSARSREVEQEVQTGLSRIDSARPPDPAGRRAVSVGGDLVASAEVILEVEGLSGRGGGDISFKLHKGEVLGVAGLLGAGRSRLARMPFGLESMTGGTIRIGGNEHKSLTPEAAKDLGMALVPEDWRRQGLVLQHSIEANIELPILRRLGTIFVDAAKSRSRADRPPDRDDRRNGRRDDVRAVGGRNRSVGRRSGRIGLGNDGDGHRLGRAARGRGDSG